MIVIHRTDVVGIEEVHLEFHLRDDHGIMDVLGLELLGSGSFRQSLESMLGLVGGQFPEANGVRLRGPLSVHPGEGDDSNSEYQPLWYCARFVVEAVGYDDALRDMILALVGAVWSAFIGRHKFLNGALVRKPTT